MMRKNKKNNLLIAKRKGKERGCTFCKSKTDPKWEGYESYNEFLSPRGTITAAQYTGVCAKHQRKLIKTIKQARHLALMPFVTQ
jgi:small subunit ribosomal protein S18